MVFLFLGRLLPWGIVTVSAQSLIDASLEGTCKWSTGRMTAACLPMFIGHVITVLVGMLGAFFVINVMIAGFQITVGAAIGDKEKGKERLRWSIIGFVVSVLCYVILNVIFSVLTGT